MPKLTIKNLTASNLQIQEPTGNYGFSQTLLPGQSRTYAVSWGLAEALEPTLMNLEAAGRVTWSAGIDQANRLETSTLDSNGDYWQLYKASTPSPMRNLSSIAPTLDGGALIVSGRPSGGPQLCANLTRAAAAGDLIIQVNDLSVFNQDPADLPSLVGLSLDMASGNPVEYVLVKAFNTATNEMTLCTPVVGNYAIGTTVGYRRNAESTASTELYKNGVLTAGPAVPPIGSGATTTLSADYVVGATTIVVTDATPFPASGYPYPVMLWNEAPLGLYTGQGLVTNVTGNTLTIQWPLPTSPASPAAVKAGTKIKVSARRPQAGVVTMADGRILIFGGGGSGLGLSPIEDAVHASSFIYDPVANTMTRTGDMPWGWLTWNGMEGGGVLLDDGRVFICGNPNTLTMNEALPDLAPPSDRAAIYDPSTGVWTDTYDGATANKKMTTPRSYHTVVKLKNGKVFIAGGTGSFYPNTITPFLSSCEIFDPAAGTFTACSAMTNIPNLTHVDEAKRCWMNSALLDDGTVLVTGGFWRKVGDFVTTPAGTSGLAQKPLLRVSRTAAIYDPGTDTWSRTLPQTIGGAQGRIFRITGSRFAHFPGVGDSGLDDARIEAYDPAQKMWFKNVMQAPTRGLKRIETTIVNAVLAGSNSLTLTSLTDWLSVANVSYMAAGAYLTIGTETFEILAAAINSSTKVVTLPSNLVNGYAAGTPVVFSVDTAQIPVPIFSSGHMLRAARLGNGSVFLRGGGNDAKAYPQTTLAQAALPGDLALFVTDVSQLPTSYLDFQKICVGTAGSRAETPGVLNIDAANKVISLDRPLVVGHPAGEVVRMMQDNRLAMLYTP